MPGRQRAPLQPARRAPTFPQGQLGGFDPSGGRGNGFLQQQVQRSASQGQQVPLPRQNPLRATQSTQTTSDVGVTAEQTVSTHRPESDRRMQQVYDANATRSTDAEIKLSKTQEGEMASFEANWKENQAQYEAVAKTSGIPAKLVAALHWRESSGDFGTYLHQGDPLGKQAVNEPSDIPIFDEWGPAAEHALGMKQSIQDKLKIDAGTTDEAALATYAEYYNGLGYYNRGKSSPYDWAGTDQYSKGKYTSDGHYSSKTVDEQLGVVSMMRRVDEVEAAKKKEAAK